MIRIIQKLWWQKMIRINLENPPRDVRINREDKIKYKYLRERFKTDSDKEIFKLALRMGFFKEIQEDLKQKPEHMWQFSTFSNEDVIEMVLISRYKKEDVGKIFEGKEVLNECERYANGGINYLYNLFIEGGKEDIYIVEDILNDMRKLVKDTLIFL